MSHPTSHRLHTALSREQHPAVKSALKETLADELAEEASDAKAGGTATPSHLAGPGRLRARPRA
jgi:hypothetical protein